MADSIMVPPAQVYAYPYKDQPEINPKQIVESFVGNLSQGQQRQFDNALVELNNVKDHGDFTRYSRAEREDIVKAHMLARVPELQKLFDQPDYGTHAQTALTNFAIGEPTFKQTTGRDTLYPLGRALGAGLGAAGATALAPEAPIAAGAVGAMAGEALSEPILRKMLTDIPDPSFMDKALDVAITGGTAALTEGAAQAGKALISGPRTHAVVRNTMLGADFQPTSQEQKTLGLLQQGSEALGTADTSAEGMLTAGQIVKNRGDATIGQKLEELFSNSFGGNIFRDRQQGNVKRAAQAASAVMTNAIGATPDSSTAAEALVNAYQQRYQIARQVRRSVYDAADTLVGQNNAIDTQSIMTLMNTERGRRDYDYLMNFVKNHLPEAGAEDVADLLTKRTPLSQAQSITVGMPVNITQKISGSTGGAAAGAQGTITNTSTLSQGIVQVTTGPGQTALIPIDALETVTNEATHGNMRLFRSLMGKVERAAYDSGGKGPGGEDLLAAGRTAGYLKGIAQTAIDNSPLSTDAKDAFTLADRLYHEESTTFLNPLVRQKIQQFSSEPDKFARSLIQADNSDTLEAVYKAVGSMPTINAATITDPVARAAALNDTSQYVRGSVFWNQRIRPQLQMETIKDTIDPSTMRNFESVLTAPSSVAGIGSAGPSGAMQSSDFVKAHLFSIDGDKLFSKLGNMTPDTRSAIFGSMQNYNNWLDLAQTIKDTETRLGGMGGMFATVKQAAGFTQATGALGAAIGGVATGNPVTGLVGGGLLMAMPAIIARKMNEPQFAKRLIYAVGNPQTGTAMRVFRELGGVAGRVAAQSSANAVVSQPLSSAVSGPSSPE